MRYSVFVIASALVGAMPASAQQAPSPGAQNPQPQVLVTGKKRRVCERSVSTGSIMPHTVCRTVEEWDEIRQQSVVALERLRDQQNADQQLKLLNSVKDKN